MLVCLDNTGSAVNLRTVLLTLLQGRADPLEFSLELVDAPRTERPSSRPDDPVKRVDFAHVRTPERSISRDSGGPLPLAEGSNLTPQGLSQRQGATD